MNFHNISDFIDEIKDSLTDAQYVAGMGICKKIFEVYETTKKCYMMTYFQPVYTMVYDDDADEDEDMGEIHFELERRKVLVHLNSEQVSRIRQTNKIDTDEWSDDEEIPFNTEPMAGLPVSLSSDKFGYDVGMMITEIAVISLVDATPDKPLTSTINQTD